MVVLNDIQYCILRMERKGPKRSCACQKGDFKTVRTKPALISLNMSLNMMEINGVMFYIHFVDG